MTGEHYVVTCPCGKTHRTLADVQCTCGRLLEIHWRPDEPTPAQLQPPTISERYER